MRLFDKVAANGPPQLKQIARNGSSTVLVADVIAKYYWDSEQLSWGREDYPYARPPWPKSFVEWNEPMRRMVANDDGVYVEEVLTSLVQLGCFVTFVEGRDGCEALFQWVRQSGYRNFPRSDSPEGVALLSPVLFSRGILQCPKLSILLFMTGEGFITDDLTIGADLDLFASEKDVAMFTREFVHVVSLAFTFANCSNVNIEDDTERLQPSAKVMRRLKLPCVKRYTLNIAGHRSRRSESGEPQQVGVMPFHLCRGHFATYTAERPLFGKHVGKFWIPPHTRGREEHGIIFKDYAVSES